MDFEWDLEERKKNILGVVVGSYIRTGEPVGSRFVMDSLDNAFSSATIRNEMAALEEKGLLYQPHTSAGRVPSALGYKLYVRELMEKYELSPTEKHNIDFFVSKIGGSIDQIARESVGIASELTDCAVAAITPAAGGVLQMFEAVIAGKHMIAVFAVSNFGVTKHKIIVTDIQPERQSTSILGKILTGTFKGLSPEEISDIKITALKNELSRDCPEFLSLMPFFMEFINELKGYDVLVRGEDKVLSYPEFSDVGKAQAFLSFLTNHKDVAEVAAAGEGIEIDVLKGRVSGMSMISSGIVLGRANSLLCVFGPTRMDYARVLAGLDYLSKGITQFIRDNYIEE